MGLDRIVYFRIRINILWLRSELIGFEILNQLGFGSNPIFENYTKLILKRIKA